MIQFPTRRMPDAVPHGAMHKVMGMFQTMVEQQAAPQALIHTLTEPATQSLPLIGLPSRGCLTVL